MTNASDEQPDSTSPPDIATRSLRDQSSIGMMLSRVTPSAAMNFALALGLILAGLYVVLLFARPIVLLLAGIIIAQALMPLVNILSRKLPRAVAIAATYVTLLIVMVLIGLLIVPALVDQGQDLVDRAPDLYDQGMTWLIDNNLLSEEITSDQVADQIINWISQFGGELAAIPLTVVSTLADIALVVVTSIYWLAAGPSLRRFTLSLFPWERQGRTDAILTEMGQTMGGYVRGIAINSSLIGIVSFTLLSALGVRYALVLAVIAAILDIVPIVGPIIATIPIVGMALLDSFTLGLVVLVIWIVVQQLESYVTMPFIMRSQAEIPPLLVLLAIFWGGSIGGILGALVAIPLVGALRVFFLRVVSPGIRRWTGAIDGDVIGPPQPPASQRVS